MTGKRLSTRLQAATQPMHRKAERSGIMPGLLQADIDRATYCRLLRNLHALYDSLERALDRHASTPVVAPVRLPVLFRGPALTGDLQFLHGSDWVTLPLTATMRAYCKHLDKLSDERPGLLVAHAYVRYLGDLSGGQILRPIVRRALRLADGAGTGFYAFGDGGDVEALKSQFRAGLDALPVDPAGAEAIVAEANAAFTLHVRLFEELGAPRAQAGQLGDSSPAA